MTDDTFDLTECHRSVTFAIVSVAAAVRVDASDGAQQPKVLLLLARALRHGVIVSGG